MAAVKEKNQFSASRRKKIPEALVYERLDGTPVYYFGLRTRDNGWRNLDIAVYDKAQLKGIPLEDKYLSVPPKVVIEVDTKAALEEIPVPMDYYHQKTDELLGAGVEKLVWVFTANEKIMEAERGKDWITSGWSREITLLEGIRLNLANLMAENQL